MKDVGFAQQINNVVHFTQLEYINYYVVRPLISTAMTTGVGRARCDAHNFVENPKSPKPDHPKKVDFGPFSTPLYRPIRTLFRDGAKIVIFEGSRPQNRKNDLFCKKT